MLPTSNLHRAAHKLYLNAWAAERVRVCAGIMAQNAIISKLQDFFSATAQPEKPLLKDLPHDDRKKKYS